MKFIDKYKSASFNKRKKAIFLNYIILHYTAMKDYKEALELVSQNLSLHFYFLKGREYFSRCYSHHRESLRID